MFAEDDLLPLSTLADLVFCERRAALHLVEGIWRDNVFTVEGTHLHAKVNEEAATESRGDLRIARSLRLRSLRLGLSGIADVVEFHRLRGEVEASGLRLEGVGGFWRPFPVEYKRGKMKHERGYEVQLCAQALCMEEMLGAAVPEGAIFYGKSARRIDIAFAPTLREETEAAALRLHDLARSGRTPIRPYEKKCESCSLISICLPKTIGGGRSVEQYLSGVLGEGPEARSGNSP
ncbi:MAG: CRISPR-associated protein Cas4 [Planctomycetes bacterium]|nr:CRISPR-associated protein Cas4 [Planctomycetota bacterium]